MKYLDILFDTLLSSLFGAVLVFVGMGVFDGSSAEGFILFWLGCIFTRIAK